MNRRKPSAGSGPARRFGGAILLCCLVLATVGALALAALSRSARAGEPAAPPADFKVAFLGDQGVNANAAATLQLIEDEGADMVLHLGDLGYGNETNPQRAIDWDAQVTSVLGADFPYFALVGNHDVTSWATYQQLLLDRLALVPGATCSGDYGVMATCTYQGLLFVMSGVGTLPNVPDDATHLPYLSDALAQDDSVWRICAWHKNQTAMQVGSKPNEVGWTAYETCRQQGAIIATAHEHSYSRTKTLSSFSSQTVDPFWAQPDVVGVGTGRTFAFVSGLGGQSIRNQDRCLPVTAPYGCNGEWAKIYTSDQGASYGALFVTFHVDGDPRKATGYFKDIDGEVADSFTIYALPPMLAEPGDSDADGCSDVREAGADPLQGGLRDYLNGWDFYDVAGAAPPMGDGLPDGVVDLANDILGVIQRYAPQGQPPYDASFDRGPSAGPYPWSMTAPDGVIDLANDILGVVQQYQHDCR